MRLEQTRVLGLTRHIFLASARCGVLFSSSKIQRHALGYDAADSEDGEQGHLAGHSRTWKSSDMVHFKNESQVDRNLTRTKEVELGAGGQITTWNGLRSQVCRPQNGKKVVTLRKCSK